MMIFRAVFYCVITIVLSPYLSLAANHYWTGLPIDSNGFTDFDAITNNGYSSSRVLFVADDGDDSAAASNISSNGHYGIGDVTFDSDGVFQAPGGVSEFATISAAYAYIRDGYSDILLLKRGDTWTEAFSSGSIGAWDTYGVDANARQILSCYGTAGDRPTLQIGTNIGFSSGTASYLIVSGIRFYAHLWESSGSGRVLQIQGTVDDQLYEDCVFERNDSLVQWYPEEMDYIHENIAFRRCHFVESEQDSYTAASFFFYGVEGALFEENIWFNETGGQRFLYADNHVENATPNTIIRGNIGYHSLRTSMSLRGGGTVDKNLFVQIDRILLGWDGGTETAYRAGIITDNVILESVTDSYWSPTREEGDGEHGIFLGANNGSTVSGNILSDPTGLEGGVAIFLAECQNAGLPQMHDTDIFNNIVYGRDPGNNYGIALYVSSGLTTVTDVNIYNNDFQMVNGADEIIDHNATFSGFNYHDNRYYASTSSSTWFDPGGSLSGWESSSGDTDSSATQVSYTAPNRTLSTYQSTLSGTETTAAFMAAANGQVRWDWDDNYTAYSAINYIREGFDRDAIFPDWEDAATPSVSGITFSGVTIGQ
jgi:hypothetical protein